MRVAEGGSYEELIDPRLGHNYDPQEMLRMVASAAACIRHSARRRPKMSQVCMNNTIYTFLGFVCMYKFIIREIN